MGRTRRAVAGTIMTLALVSGCSSGDSDTAPAADDGAAIATTAPTETPGPTATPAPAAEATATPVPATEEPTETPADALSPVEDAAVAAWGRYIALAVESRDKMPSEAALDFDSYSTGTLDDDLQMQRNDFEAQGVYWQTPLDWELVEVTTRDDGAVVLSVCLRTEWEQFNAADDATLAQLEPEAVVFRSRVEEVAEGWKVAAVERTEAVCA